MPLQSSYEYAMIRVVPRVERGEYINVGVILLCLQRRYLGARVNFSAETQAVLLALAPDLDLTLVRDQLDGIISICRGGSRSGPIGKLSQAERFHWLAAPSSTIIQPSPVHTGLCDNPSATLEHLAQTLVR
jgi:Protein of unknown function (DUF3037)